MQLSDKMQDALNKQINAELYSSYLYLAMAAWFQDQNLGGFAHWMNLQAKEEYAHGMKLFGYIVERRGRVKLAAIGEPPAEWKSPLAAFEAVLEHEQNVSAAIYKLVDQARSENDHATEAMLQWYVTEQVEEEASADNVVANLRMAGESTNALMMLNQALGRRE